jgi:uncharacterized membrane protein
MAILPEGFALPPLPYLLVLAAAVLAVAGVLYRDSPPVTERTVVALAPWMVSGSALHVLYRIGAVPAVVAPFFGSPAVYLTTFVFLGGVWTVARRRTPGDDTATDGATAAGADRTDRTDVIDKANRTPTSGPTTASDPAMAANESASESATTASVLGVVGAVLALSIVGFALAVGLRGSLRAFWPAVGLIVSVALAAATWIVARRGQVGEAGWAGVLVVFAHALDGVSTAVGVDVLGFGEQTPLARVFLQAAASLPVSDLLGTGWLFVAVKVGLAVFITWLLADSVRERPREGYLLCAFVAAVGLGPGAHNLLLFVVAG